MNIVVKSAGGPLLVRFARRVRDGRRAIQVHVPTGRRLTHHKRVASFVGCATLHQRELPREPESKPSGPHSAGDGLTGDAVLHGDPFGSALRSYQAVCEMEGRYVS